MSVHIGDVPTFKHVSLDKQQALKVLEEASEVVDAFKAYYETRQTDWTEPDNVTDYQMARQHLLDECADVFQATSNLLSALGVVDMTKTLERCKAKNERRGHEYEQVTEASKSSAIKASNKPDSKFDARKTAEMPETDAAKCDIRDFDDTREKLEADICAKLNDMARFSWCVDGIFRQAQGWLNRQAAITRREVLCNSDERDEQAPEGDALEIMRKCADELHGMGALRKRLDVDCTQGWQMRCLRKLAYMIERDYMRREYYYDRVSDLGEQIAELQASLDSVKRAIAKAGGTWTQDDDGSVSVVFAPDVDKLRAERDELERANSRQVRKIHGVCKINKKLTAERDMWRDKCGKMLDIAHEITRLGDVE